MTSGYTVHQSDGMTKITQDNRLEVTFNNNMLSFLSSIGVLIN